MLKVSLGRMDELGESRLSHWALSLIVGAWNYQQRASKDYNLVSLSHPCYTTEADSSVSRAK
jgi:hypothetical protein